MNERRDAVDHIAAQWAEERPDLDVKPMEVVGRLHRLAALLDEELRRVFAQADLGNGDFDVLAALRRAGEPFTLTASELGAATMVTSGAVTKRVDRLEARGLVVRTIGTHDGRARAITLTDEGRRLQEELHPQHLANEDHLLRSLDAGQRDTLADLLRTVLLDVE